MPTRDASRGAVEEHFDKRRLDALGVLLPLRLNALSFLPGRHPLGRAGEGMRFLRSRPYEPGQDNPRDIDKFSPEGEYWINEWESESQATVRICADVSSSMSVDGPASVRNLALLQLTYSLWRASDRVATVFYGASHVEEIAERNLKSQFDRLLDYLGSNPLLPGQDALDMLSALTGARRAGKYNLLFIVSDFNAASDPQGQEDARRWRPLLRSLSCDVVPVIVSFELSTAQRGHIKLWDAEHRRRRLTLLTPARAARINAEEVARVGRLERLFRSLGLDCMTLRHETDVYPALAALARLRRKRCT
jgi:uncharacterized protein (DUF58 family)